MFKPEAGQSIDIGGAVFCVAPGSVVGSRSTVYKLSNGTNAFALKVLEPSGRLPYVADMAERMRSYAALPALQACKRRVIIPASEEALLLRYPDLAFSILMPWAEGPTFAEVLKAGRRLQPEVSLALAGSLLEALIALEERGSAHTDISSSNVLLPLLQEGEGVRLVGLEQLYIKGSERPETIASSPGYTFPRSSPDEWGPLADRYAASILLAEMLGLSSPTIPRQAWGESFFGPSELARDCPRFRVLSSFLKEAWGSDVAHLFRRNWFAETLDACAPFSEWKAALPAITAFPPAVTASTPAAADRRGFPVRVILSCLLAFFFFAATTGGVYYWSHGSKNAHYNAGQEAMNNQDYQAARREFEKAGGYRDSEILMMKAEALEQEAVKAAELERERQAQYEEAVALMDQGQWLQAYPLLKSIQSENREYRDVASRVAYLEKTPQNTVLFSDDDVVACGGTYRGTIKNLLGQDIASVNVQREWGYLDIRPDLISSFHLSLTCKKDIFNSYGIALMACNDSELYGGQPVKLALVPRAGQNYYADVGDFTFTVTIHQASIIGEPILDSYTYGADPVFGTLLVEVSLSARQ